MIVSTVFVVVTVVTVVVVVFFLLQIATGCYLAQMQDKAQQKPFNKKKLNVAFSVHSFSSLVFSIIIFFSVAVAAADFFPLYHRFAAFAFIVRFAFVICLLVN